MSDKIGEEVESVEERWNGLMEKLQARADREVRAGSSATARVELKSVSFSDTGKVTLLRDRRKEKEVDRAMLEEFKAAYRVGKNHSSVVIQSEIHELSWVY